MMDCCFEEGMFVRRQLCDQPVGTIVYIHGLGESGLCFVRLIEDPRLSSWDHVVPDLPGYGKSSWRHPPLSLPELVAGLLTWLEQRESSRVMLLGHSMGGVLGTLLCEQRPDLFSGFVNVEGNLSEGDCTFSGQAALHSEQAFISSGGYQLFDAVYSDGGDEPAMRSYYASLRMCDPSAFHKNSVELVKVSRGEQLAKRLRDVEVPYLYLLGHPRGCGERSIQLLDEAQANWLKVEDAGHWPFVDQQDAFVAVLLTFLEQHGGKGGERLFST